MTDVFLPTDKHELLKREKCKDFTNDQFAVFLHAIERFRLDPFSNQIYGIIRAKRLSVQTGIDGFRLVADRTKAYAGNDDPVYNDELRPTKATVTVYKFVGGQRCPFTASARWSQYCPKGNAGQMWERMPHLMLGKCAEALALRKAFPAELSGLYTADEMAQANTPAPPSDTSPPAATNPLADTNPPPPAQSGKHAMEKHPPKKVPTDEEIQKLFDSATSTTYLRYLLSQVLAAVPSLDRQDYWEKRIKLQILFRDGPPPQEQLQEVYAEHNDNVKHLTQLYGLIDLVSNSFYSPGQKAHWRETIANRIGELSPTTTTPAATE